MRQLAVLLFVVGAGEGAAHAGPRPDLAAAAVVRRALERMVFRSSAAEMTLTMTLRNRRGETRTRQLFARTSRVDGLSRTLVRFLAPSDVAGTAFLLIANRGRADDQFMFLPALKIVRRIVGQQKQSRFMGSDFTYADLEWQDLEQAVYTALPEEQIGRDRCHVIDAVPRSKSANGRLRSWIRVRDEVPLRITFFDPGGLRPVKTLFVKQIKQVDGAPIVTQLKMSDRQSGHSTYLTIDRIVRRQDLPPDSFTVEALKQR